MDCTNISMSDKRLLFSFCSWMFCRVRPSWSELAKPIQWQKSIHRSLRCLALWDFRSIDELAWLICMLHRMSTQHVRCVSWCPQGHMPYCGQGSYHFEQTSDQFKTLSHIGYGNVFSLFLSLSLSLNTPAHPETHRHQQSTLHSRPYSYVSTLMHSAISQCWYRQPVVNMMTLYTPRTKFSNLIDVLQKSEVLMRCMQFCWYFHLSANASPTMLDLPQGNSGCLTAGEWENRLRRFAKRKASWFVF